jgi:hypothetical protein
MDEHCRQRTVSQAYFVFHETLHEVQKFEGKDFLVLTLPLRHF